MPCQRTILLRIWCLLGGTIFLLLFWRYEWPLWSRVLGWTSALLLLVFMPTASRIRHFFVRSEGAPPKPVSQRSYFSRLTTGLSLKVVRTESTTKARLNRSMVFLWWGRTLGFTLRGLLGALLVSGLWWAWAEITPDSNAPTPRRPPPTVEVAATGWWQTTRVPAFFGFETPQPDRYLAHLRRYPQQRFRPPRPGAQPFIEQERPPGGPVYPLMMLALIAATLVAIQWRAERLAIELTPIPGRSNTLHYLELVLIDLLGIAWTILASLLCGIMLTIFVGYFVLLVWPLESWDPPRFLFDYNEWPRWRPLWEVGWFPVLGLLFMIWRYRRAAWDSHERQWRFARTMLLPLEQRGQWKRISLSHWK